MSTLRILLVSTRLGRIFVLVLFGLLSVGARAHAQQDQATWHVLIEPHFMHPEVSFPITGAQDTIMVPAYMRDGDPEYFSKKQWDALNTTWDAFRARAGQNATDHKIACELVRDSKKVIQYAAITSEDPLTATMILSPDFLKKFQDIFGPTILATAPNRYTVFVFPGLASDYKSFSNMVLRAYHDSTYPVSLELFEISPKGIRAIGAFEDD